MADTFPIPSADLTGARAVDLLGCPGVLPTTPSVIHCVLQPASGRYALVGGYLNLTAADLTGARAFELVGCPSALPAGIQCVLQPVLGLYALVGPSMSLTHADLTGVDLTGADLTGADLTGAEPDRRGPDRRGPDRRDRRGSDRRDHRRDNDVPNRPSRPLLVTRRLGAGELGASGSEGQVIGIAPCSSGGGSRLG
jgi:hypothetical protein